MGASAVGVPQCGMRPFESAAGPCKSSENCCSYDGERAVKEDLEA